MPVTCSECSNVNPDNSTFCVKCGNRLPQVNPASQYGGGTSVPTFLSPSAQPSSPQQSSAYAPPDSSSPGAPSFPHRPPAMYPPASDTIGMGQPQWQPQTVAPPPPTPQMGTAQGLASLRRAFAGRGTLIMHHSWLLTGSNAYAQSGAVSAAILTMLRQRNIAGASVTQEKLMERGIAMEEREYIVTRRGITTLFTYVAPAGQELYISRATTAQPAISYIRVGIAALLVLLMVIGFIEGGIATSSLSGPAAVGPLGLLLWFLAYPIAIFLVVMLIRSCISWLIENDFLVYLRASSLNDFQQDDIAMLERIIDDTAREAVQQVGLDGSKIIPPQMVQSYQPRNRIRRL